MIKTGKPKILEKRRFSPSFFIFAIPFGVFSIASLREGGGTTQGVTEGECATIEFDIVPMSRRLLHRFAEPPLGGSLFTDHRRIVWRVHIAGGGTPRKRLPFLPQGKMVGGADKARRYDAPQVRLPTRRGKLEGRRRDRGVRGVFTYTEPQERA